MYGQPAAYGTGMQPPMAQPQVHPAIQALMSHLQGMQGGAATGAAPMPGGAATGAAPMPGAPVDRTGAAQAFSWKKLINPFGHHNDPPPVQPPPKPADQHLGYPNHPPVTPGQPYSGFDQRNWLNFGQDEMKNYLDWMTQQGRVPTLSDFLNHAGAPVANQMGAYGGRLAGLGYANLAQILANQGHVDPRAGNATVAGIQRNAQNTQQATQGELARRGLGGSGVGQALAQSATQAGANQINTYRANEAQQAEQQKRQDLQTLLQLVINPSMDASSLALGQFNADRSNRNTQTAANDAQNSKLIEMFLAAICHATAELFGDCSIEVEGVRYYMVNEAPSKVGLAYARNSKAFAYELAHSESLSRTATPVFAAMAQRGLAALGA